MSASNDDVEPLAHSVARAKPLLGVKSNSTIFKAINAGELERVYLLSKTLITDRSIKKCLGLDSPRNHHQTGVATGKSIQANRVQALISKMFSFAVDADLLPANPCLRLRKRASEEARRRVLSDTEIALFWYRITKRPVSRRIGLALRLVLLTGVRVTDVAGAELTEFTHLDGNQASWSIPPARSKNGRAHVVPLSLYSTGDRERAGRHCQRACQGVGEARG